jgi:hypothetical protein
VAEEAAEAAAVLYYSLFEIYDSASADDLLFLLQVQAHGDRNQNSVLYYLFSYWYPLCRPSHYYDCPALHHCVAASAVVHLYPSSSWDLYHADNYSSSFLFLPVPEEVPMKARNVTSVDRLLDYHVHHQGSGDPFLLCCLLLVHQEGKDPSCLLFLLIYPSSGRAVVSLLLPLTTQPRTQSPQIFFNMYM